MSRTQPIEKPRPKTRWTYEEYYRMADAGVFQDRHVELIGGEIIEMPPQGEPHYVTIMKTAKALENAFGTGYVVRTQAPLRTGVDEEPEPDVAVIIGKIDDTLTTGRPRSALIVAEISVSTLDYDRGTKNQIYAGAGIEEYWVVDVESRLLHVHRRTIPDPSFPGSRQYSQIEVLDENASVTLLAMPNSSIRVRDVLP